MDGTGLYQPVASLDMVLADTILGYTHYSASPLVKTEYVLEIPLVK